MADPENQSGDQEQTELFRRPGWATVRRPPTGETQRPAPVADSIARINTGDLVRPRVRER